MPTAKPTMQKEVTISGVFHRTTPKGRDVWDVRVEGGDERYTVWSETMADQFGQGGTFKVEYDEEPNGEFRNATIRKILIEASTNDATTPVATGGDPSSAPRLTLSEREAAKEKKIDRAVAFKAAIELVKGDTDKSAAEKLVIAAALTEDALVILQGTFVTEGGDDSEDGS